MPTRLSWLGFAVAALLVATVALALPVARAALRGGNGLIAFTSERQRVRRLYAMQPDGSQVTEVFSGDDARKPVWSPDGTQIAFEMFDNGLWVVDADGSDARQLTTGVDANPSWSPD